MKDTASIVRTILSENPTEEEIDKLVNKLEDKVTIEYSLLLDYLRIKSTEICIETVKYIDKKTEIDRIVAEYTEYLRNILELEKNKNISIVERTKRLIEKSVNSDHITREDKIYIGEEKERVKRSVISHFSIKNILIYISMSLLGKIEILKIEKNILSISYNPKEDINHPSETTNRKMTVYKLEGTAHPIRITGRTTQEDLRKILEPTNSPTMTIEQYGERIMKIVELEQKQQKQTAPQEKEQTSEEEFLSELSINETEETRQKKEREEDTQLGDGNRIGRR